MAPEPHRRWWPYTAWIAALCIAGCGHAPQAWFPPGVVAPSAPPGALVGGIYTSVTPNDRFCCWAAQSSSFRVEKPDAATDLALRIYLPERSSFRTAPQSFTVTLDGRHRIDRCCFGPGLHTVLFPLPASLRARTGRIGVQVHARRAIVPSREGFAPDDRELAFVFVSVGFTSFMSGRF